MSIFLFSGLQDVQNRHWDKNLIEQEKIIKSYKPNSEIVDHIYLEKLQFDKSSKYMKYLKNFKYISLLM